MNDFRIVAAGDAALVAEFESRIDPVVNQRVLALAERLREVRVPGVRDIVPAFCSVTVYFDPLATDVGRLTDRMRAAAVSSVTEELATRAHVEVPVCYDADFATDLDDVARFSGLSPEDVIAVHSALPYRVFMLGFVPGFAYLGTVDARIAAPRRNSPRLQVPAGSVAIAGRQTGIYPRQTPGGWNLIGRTPLEMVSLDRARPSRLNPGDMVRFIPIDRLEFDRIRSAQERVL